MDTERGDALREALRAALAPPYDEVDWDELHRRVMAASAARIPAARARARDWIVAWAPRAIPITAAALAAAIAVVFLGAPAPRAPAAHEAPPPEFWPVAVELFAGLDREAARLIGAGENVADWLAAVFSAGGTEAVP